MSISSRLRNAVSRLPTRGRVTVVLVVTIMSLLATALNLKSLYDNRCGYSCRKSNAIAYGISLASQMVLSIPLLVIASFLLSRCPGRFISSVVVGVTVTVMYIVLTLLIDRAFAWHGRIIATWSVIGFWLAFAVEAATGIGFWLVGWVASKVEQWEMGWISLSQSNNEGGEDDALLSADDLDTAPHPKTQV